MKIKEPTLPPEQIKLITNDLAQKYIKETELAVQNKECPQNIYKFTSQNFRPIEGHDTEWYAVFEGWKRILYLKGWNTQWRRSCETMDGIMDYQYCYSEKLDWVPPIPPIQMSEDGLSIVDPRILRFMFDAQSSMDGSKCSQLLG